MAEKNVDAAIIDARNAVQRDPQFGEAYRKLATAPTSPRGRRRCARALTAADLLPESVDAQTVTGELLLHCRPFRRCQGSRPARALARSDVDARRGPARQLDRQAEGHRLRDRGVRRAIRLDLSSRGLHRAGGSTDVARRAGVGRADLQAGDRGRRVVRAGASRARPACWSTNRPAELSRR